MESRLRKCRIIILGKHFAYDVCPLRHTLDHVAASSICDRRRLSLVELSIIIEVDVDRDARQTRIQVGIVLSIAFKIVKFQSANQSRPHIAEVETFDRLSGFEVDGVPVTRTTQKDCHIAITNAGLIKITSAGEGNVVDSVAIQIPTHNGLCRHFCLEFQSLGHRTFNVAEEHMHRVKAAFGDDQIRNLVVIQIARRELPR